MSEIHGRGMLADLLRQAGVFALPRDTVAAKAAGRRVSAISTWFVCNVHTLADFRGNGQEEAARLLVAFLEGVLEANENDFPVQVEAARKALWARFEDLKSRDLVLPTPAA